MKHLIIEDYHTIEAVKGPLLFITGVRDVAYGDLATIYIKKGASLTGQVIEISHEFAVLQVFGPTRGISPAGAVARFRGEPVMMGLSPYILGRMFKGDGAPLDGAPPLIAAERRDINGSAINPVRRDLPLEFLQTGVSAIEGLNTLVRGQKAE